MSGWKGKPKTGKAGGDQESMISKWSRSPKPSAQPDRANANLKYTCQCGYSSTTTPDHKCLDGVWGAGDGRPGGRK